MNNLLGIIIFALMFIVNIFLSLFGCNHSKLDLKGGSKLENFNQKNIEVIEVIL